jgi:hypothetical protein
MCLKGPRGACFISDTQRRSVAESGSGGPMALASCDGRSAANAELKNMVKNSNRLCDFIAVPECWKMLIKT